MGSISQFPASEQRRTWVQTASDVVFGVCCFAAAAAIVLVGAAVCGLLWLAVGQ